MYICKDCKRQCTPFIQDIGNGPYEYFGSRGVHIEYVVSSDCCEAEVVDETTGRIIVPEDLEP